MTDLFRVIDKILNPTEKKVLCCNFGIGDRQRSGYELSLELNKTEERIRQIKEAALFKLRSSNEGKTLLAKYLYL
jgi:DNA-directed RNA polymerase sigma subunit (sigma70/sigma32)